MKTAFFQTKTNSTICIYLHTFLWITQFDQKWQDIVLEKNFLITNPKCLSNCGSTRTFINCGAHCVKYKFYEKKGAKSHVKSNRDSFTKTKILGELSESNSQRIVNFKVLNLV